MTPKEKAKQLVNIYKEVAYSDYLIQKQIDKNAKECALIVVNEILSDYKNYLMHENTEYKGLKYWQEVKQEIEKL